MSNDKPTPPAPAAPRLRLPGFVRDEQIGLGDLVTRAASAVGVRPCGGCTERAVALNRWVAFGRRPAK